MAIQGVSFMGREGCITKPVKDAGKKAIEYMGKEPTGDVKKVEVAVKDAVRKTDVQSYLDSHAPIANESKVSADEIAAAYRASHGIPSV